MHFGEGGGLDGSGMWHTLGEKKSGVLCGKLKERDCVKDEGIDGMLILKWVLKN
jgi:hypothetical protein